MVKKKEKLYHFTAPLSPLGGQIAYTGVFIPDEIMEQLPKGRLRTKGLMNNTPFSLAIQYRKAGNSFLMVSATMRRALKIRMGEQVKVQFELVDPDIVDMPEELEAVLSQDEEAAALYYAFTPGLQRSLAHYVHSVKNVDSRIKRALELAYKIKTRTLYRDREK